MRQDISADHGAGGADPVDHVGEIPGADKGASGLIQLAGAVIPQPPIILAQAGAIGAQPQGPYVPMLAPGAAFTTAGPTTAYAIGVDGTVHLPAGTTLAMAEVVGNDLHLMQEDGTLIVIVGGGIAIPLIFIGGVAFNPDVIASLIGLGQVQPAAPAVPPGGVGGSAGGEFGQPAGLIDPNAIDLTDLLPPTALQFGIPEIEQIGFDFDDEPAAITENPSVIADDDDLSGGNAGGVGDDASANLSGTVAHDFGDNQPGTIGFLTSGAPAGFTYELSGTSLLILQDGTLVLTVMLNPDTGAYTVIQNSPIQHTAGENENDQDFTLTYRVSDSDGDFVDGTLNISVDDDTPTVMSGTTAVLDDDQFAGGNPGGPGDDAIANTSGNIGFSFGADGAGSAVFLTTGAPAGFSYELSGSSLLIKQGATTVLTVTLNDETGVYTVTQNAVIDHAAGDEENNSVFELTYRVTDADGDVVDGTLTVSVDDDTPTVTSNGAVVVDEDDLPAGNGDSAPGDDAPANVTGTLGHSFGADGAGAIALLASGAPAGFTYTLSNNGTVLKINQNSSDTDILRVTINANTGAYEVELLNPLDHPISGTEGNLSFTINYSVTDGDGDSTNGTLSIDVDDDSPTSAGEQPRPISVTVLEDGLAQASGDLSDGNREGGETTADDEAFGAAGSLSSLFAVGADQPLSVTLSNNTSGLPTLFSKGDAVTYSVSGTVLTATADAGGPDQRVVFTLTVNADGSWSFDLKDQLDHVDNGLNDENFALRTNAGGTTSVGAIDFSSVILGSDNDGDTAPAAPGSFTVAVQDDVPTGMVSGTVSVHVDEDNLSTGAGDLSNGIDDGDAEADEATFSSLSLAALVAPGADEPLDFNLNNALAGNVVTTGGAAVLSQGTNVVWGTNAGALVGFVNLGGGAGFDLGIDREVFRVSDNGNGTFTFDLKDQIDHTPAAGDNGVLALDLTSALTAIDNDGDALTLNAASISVVVENDVPDAENDTNTAFEGGPAIVGNVLTNDALGADEGTVGANMRVSFVESGNVPANGSAIGSGGNAVIGGQFGSITLNADGSYSYAPNADIASGGVDVFTYTLIDADGDTTTATLSITVENVDRFPDAIQDEAEVPEGGQVVNAAFVLDFSGSIDNIELDQQLDAVKAAGQALFNAGTAIITIIIFASSAQDRGTFSDFATFEAAIDAMNPAEGGTRPLDSSTNFTAGIEMTMDQYVPLDGTNNQVFFISDGNPNVQTGSGGNALANATASAWLNFINDNDVNVTTIGVGDNINNARLQDVDLDGQGAPIMIGNFDDLIAALLDVVGGDTSGNVLDNDTPGDGAITIVSIRVDLTSGPGGIVTFTYDTVNNEIDRSDGGASIAGSALEVETGVGGHLEFHFTDGVGVQAGDWTYEAPGNVPGDVPVDETFHYVIRDADNDLDGADLIITVAPNTPPVAGNDDIRTNQVDGMAIVIPFAALMQNDNDPDSMSFTVAGVSGASGGTVTVDYPSQSVLFTPTSPGFSTGSFTYTLADAQGGTDTAIVTLSGVSTQQVGPGAPGQLLIGSERVMYFSITGDDQYFGGLEDADEEEIFTWDGITLREIDGGSGLVNAGEDIDALQVFTAGGYLFSIGGDDEEFNDNGLSGVGTNEADNEDIFTADEPSDTSITKAIDGSTTWSANDINALYQYSNGNLVIVFDQATTIDGVTYNSWEMVLYNPGTEAFSEFADGMLDSGIVDAVDVLANGDILFSMNAAVTLDAVTYDDADVIRWDGSSYSTFFNSADYGMLGDAEDIDAISIRGSDILVGGPGNDIMFGLSGEDILTGNGGADTLSGGGGNDTFVLTDALGADIITDYSSGDAVDLSALLDQALIQGGSQGTLADFVKLTDAGPDRVLQIDANGAAGGSNFTTVAVFDPIQPATVHILYDNAEANVPQT